MTQIDRLQKLGLFEARVPRYTSYPTAPIFSAAVGAGEQGEALARLDPAQPLSLYLHIPFCERLCWFCACRTQGTRTLSPVASYLESLEAELALLRAHLPEGIRMGQMHWGGGTPTILPPEMIHRLARAVKAVLPPTEDWEFSVEIDPTLVDGAKIAALAAEGMTRASIGIQDFDPLVQRAIGRQQPVEVTRACIADLRAAGIASLNADLVYGLPHQTSARLERTLAEVLALTPDRIALFGYAHVPWMSKRQRLIDAESLPDERARFALAGQAAARFAEAGYVAIGIDHFARPENGLARAAKAGRLRRNFQGYVADDCRHLLGLGASAISRLPGGYFQNAPATAAYAQRIAEGTLACARGHLLNAEDRLRGRAIEMIMCDFALDLARLPAPAETLLAPILARLSAEFGELLDMRKGGFAIRPEGRALTRIIASRFDAHQGGTARYSQAS